MHGFSNRVNGSFIHSLIHSFIFLGEEGKKKEAPDGGGEGDAVVVFFWQVMYVCIYVCFYVYMYMYVCMYGTGKQKAPRAGVVVFIFIFFLFSF